MTNTALQRLTQAALTNKSGGTLAYGAVVVADLTTAMSCTTTTTSGFLNGIIGVVIEKGGIVNNAIGMVAFSGPVPQINLSASASIGDMFKTHTVAGQAVRHAPGIQAGDFGIAMGTGTTPAAILWGLPAGATGAGLGDFVGPGSAVDGNLVVFDGTTGKLGKDGGAPAGSTGWAAAGETWTYVSADGPTGTFSVPADVTGKYSVGMRIKLTQTTAKYFIVTVVGAFAAGVTPITIYGGTDYTLANAAITLPFYSTAKAPFGFNVDPAKWTETTTDSTQRAQATPTASVWYNPGAVSLVVPIGTWRLRYKVIIQCARAAAAAIDIYATLSTANNSESDSNMTCFASTSSQAGVYATVSAEKFVVLAAKTTHYLDIMEDIGGTQNIYMRNDTKPCVIKATCALL